MEKFARSCTVAVLLSLSLWLTPVSVAIAAQSASRVTVLYDAFGNPSKLVKDWGYARSSSTVASASSSTPAMTLASWSTMSGNLALT